MMKAVMAKAGGALTAGAPPGACARRSTRRGCHRVRRRVQLVRKQVELDNAVAAELAGSEDAVLRTLEGHLDCDVYLRGNVLTLEGDADRGRGRRRRRPRALRPDRTRTRDRYGDDRSRDPGAR